DADADADPSMFMTVSGVESIAMNETKKDVMLLMPKRKCAQFGGRWSHLNNASLQLEGTTHSVCLDVLRLFAHGTWGDYKSVCIPQLSPHQILKLKQLTLLTLAESNKVLPYHTLMVELDVTNVRQLEDFLINACMYAGIVRGKLDQLKRCFEVEHIRKSSLFNLRQVKMGGQMDKKHRKEAGEGVEEVKRSLSMKVSDTCLRPSLSGLEKRRLLMPRVGLINSLGEENDGQISGPLLLYDDRVYRWVSSSRTNQIVGGSPPRPNIESTVALLLDDDESNRRWLFSSTRNQIIGGFCRGGSIRMLLVLKSKDLKRNRDGVIEEHDLQVKRLEDNITQLIRLVLLLPQALPLAMDQERRRRFVINKDEKSNTGNTFVFG
ncbi:hypothetical protein HID58_063744, partial [Brassica napus]